MAGSPGRRGWAGLSQCEGQTELDGALGLQPSASPAGAGATGGVGRGRGQSGPSSRCEQPALCLGCTVRMSPPRCREPKAGLRLWRAASPAPDRRRGGDRGSSRRGGAAARWCGGWRDRAGGPTCAQSPAQHLPPPGPGGREAGRSPELPPRSWGCCGQSWPCAGSGPPPSAPDQRIFTQIRC